MTRPYGSCLFLSLSLINLSTGLSCSETPCGSQRQGRESSGGINDPQRALQSQHGGSACHAPVGMCCTGGLPSHVAGVSRVFDCFQSMNESECLF